MTTPTPARYDTAETVSEAQPVRADDLEGFNMADWVSGVTSVRRSDTIYQRGDLLADVDVLKNRWLNAKLKGDSKTQAKLMRQMKPLVEQIERTALDVVVEGRSQDWIDEFRSTIKEHNPDITDDDVNIAQVAAQIVQPEGLDLEFVQHLFTVIRPQMEKIVALVGAVNSKPVVVSLPS